MDQLVAQLLGAHEYFNQLIDQIFGAHAVTVLQILKIIGINIILSGDNAVVIALACRNLPPRQRWWGIMLGAGAAVVLRVIFTLMVMYLLNDVPVLRLVGGLLLFWIAIKLLIQEEAGDEVAAGANLWEAVKIVTIADIVMSLDNVLAIGAAAQGEPWLMILGLVISIPLVVFGATMITALLTRYPILVWAGAALLGWIAGELIATEPVLKTYMAQIAQSIGMTEKFVARAFEVIGALIVILGGLIVSRKGHAAEKHAAE